MTYIQSAKIELSKKYDSITIGLASPEMILARSYGEILKPETINYRSYKPEKMDYSVKRSLVLLRIMNVIAVNTRAFVIVE